MNLRKLAQPSSCSMACGLPLPPTLPKTHNPTIFTATILKILSNHVVFTFASLRKLISTKSPLHPHHRIIEHPLTTNVIRAQCKNEPRGLKFALSKKVDVSTNVTSPTINTIPIHS